MEDCRSLARFRLSGIPPLPPGAARVEVTFAVDADGLLKVTARELSTGVQQAVEVKPSHGLSDDEIETMLLDAIEHAEDDITVRQLREQRVEATRLLKDAHKQLEENGDLLSPEELLGVRQACAAVESAASGKDHVAIKDAIAALDVVSRPVAERIMDRTMGKALSGHRVEEF